MVRGLVTSLESNFDNISETLHTSVNFGHEWKTDALSLTLKEIPRVQISGSEVGTMNGYGDDIYTEDKLFRNTVCDVMKCMIIVSLC